MARKQRKSGSSAGVVAKKLGKHREGIDRADRLLLSALSARLKVVHKVGKLKVQHDLPLFQRERWLALLADRLKAGKKLGLSVQFTEKLFKLIHQESLRIQKGIAK